MSFANRFFTGFSKPLLNRFLGDTIIWYPGGDLTMGQDIRALVSLDTELGTNEVSGDGAVTRDVHGDRERRTGRLSVDSDLSITESDLWRIDGEIWTTIRQDARDSGIGAGYQDWRIVTKLGRRTQHTLLKEDRPIRRA